MKLYHQQVCSIFVLGKGYVRITETLLGHPSFRDTRRLTASPVQADMLDDFYAYDEDGTRYVWGRGVSLLTFVYLFKVIADTLLGTFAFQENIWNMHKHETFLDMYWVFIKHLNGLCDSVFQTLEQLLSLWWADAVR